MSVTPTKLYDGTPAAGPATVYTAPAGGMVIAVMVAANPTGGAASITVTVAGTPVWAGKSIPANDYERMGGPIQLDAGDTIEVTSPSGALHLHIHGFAVA